MKINTLALAAFLLAACNGTADDDIDVDSRAVCDCPEQTAADVAYDNVGSGLAGADVQDAVDELAAKPEGLPDAFERVMLIEQTTTSSASVAYHYIAVQCPGDGEDASIALGGGCSQGASGADVESNELGRRGYICTWNKPVAAEIEFTARVTCLGKAGVSYE